MLGRDPETCDQTIVRTCRPPNGDAIRLAQSRRRHAKRVEYRLEVGGRATDDFQHVGGSSLLLTRFVEFAREQCNDFLFGIRAARLARASRR